MAAHAAVKQTRKYTNEPYWIHPFQVATILFTIIPDEIRQNPAMLFAALLHDVIEDTGIDSNHLFCMLSTVTEHGERSIARYVESTVAYVDGLSDVSKPEDGNRETRKALDLAHTAKQGYEVQTIKCCDLISNTISIVTHDPDFARTYLVEKEKLLDVMTSADPLVMIWARRVLQMAQEELVQLHLGTK